MVSGPFYANEDYGVSLLIRVYQLPREVRVPLQAKPLNPSAGSNLQTLWPTEVAKRAEVKSFLQTFCECQVHAPGKQQFRETPLWLSRSKGAHLFGKH
jgi:hypothetical protein